MNIDNDENMICEFEEWSIADGKAAKTLESYVGDIRTFHQWLKSKGDIYIENLKRFHITSYRNYLVQNNYEITTINKKINSPQCINQFLIENNYISERVVDLKKDTAKLVVGSEKEIELFMDAEIEKLLFYIQSEEVTSRDRFLLKVK